MSDCSTEAFKPKHPLGKLLKAKREQENDLLYADHAFSNCQEAIEELCIGCPEERGWSFANEDIPEPIGTACKHMVDDITDCEHPIVMELDGRPFCHERYERFVKPERELYERRMKGDWS
jgi:hypothetical protein